MHTPFRKSSCHSRPRTPNANGGDVLDSAILNGGALLQTALDDQPGLRERVAVTLAAKMQRLRQASQEEKNPKCPS
jgi:hypothetical protein